MEREFEEFFENEELVEKFVEDLKENGFNPDEYGIVESKDLIGYAKILNKYDENDIAGTIDFENNKVYLCHPETEDRSLPVWDGVDFLYDPYKNHFEFSYTGIEKLKEYPNVINLLNELLPDQVKIYYDYGKFYIKEELINYLNK